MKKRVLFVVAMVLVMALALCGCGAKMSDNAAAEDSAPSGGYDGAANSQSNSGGNIANYGEIDYESDVIGGNNASALVEMPQSQDRKVIYNANLGIQTKEFSESQKALAAAVSAAGGYIESSNISGGYYSSNSNYTQQRLECVVRIPSDNFQSFLSSAESIGEVTSLSYESEDVTLTYLDMEARVSSLETQEQRLLELMAEANSLDEMLTLENRLGDVRYEIESLKSQLNLFDDLVSYSTVYIYLNEEIEVAPVAKEDFWSRAWYSIRNSATVVLRVLDGLAMVLIYAAPWLVLLLVIWLLLRKKLKQNRAQKKQKAKERYEMQLKAQAEANAAMQAQMQRYAQPQAVAQPIAQPQPQAAAQPVAQPQAAPQPPKQSKRRANKEKDQ